MSTLVANVSSRKRLTVKRGGNRKAKALRRRWRQRKRPQRCGTELSYLENCFGLHELKRRGHRIELAGRENIDGIQYYVLRLTLSDGYLMTLFVDPKNWLITRRRDVGPLHVDVDPTPTTIEQRSSDFRTIGGVQFAFASSETDLQSGKVLETTAVRSVKINPALAPTIFERL